VKAGVWRQPLPRHPDAPDLNTGTSRASLGEKRRDHIAAIEGVDGRIDDRYHGLRP